MAHLRRPGLYPVPAWVLYSPYSLGKFLERPAATREDFGAPCCHTAVMLFVLNAVVGLARNFAGRVGNLCGYFDDLPIRPSERRFRPPAGPLHEQGKGLQALLTWMRATGVDHTTTPAKAGPDHLFLVATLLTDVVSLHMEFQNGMNYSEGHLHIEKVQRQQVKRASRVMLYICGLPMARVIRSATCRCPSARPVRRRARMFEHP